MTTYRSPLLDRPGAVSGATGVAAHYGDPMGEQRALAGGRGVVDLSDHGVIRLTGPDRLTWLHSLTTQYLLTLGPRQSTELLILSPNGHVEHHAAVVDDAASTYLITAPGRTTGLAAWLDSMRFTLRVEVTDITKEFAAIGEPVNTEGAESEPVTWRDPWPVVAPGGTRYGLPDDEHPGSQRPWRLVLVDRAELAAAVAAREAAGWRLAGTWASEALRIAAWRPGMSDVDHRTIPHEMDWLRTAVHLEKGCYRGQETVARVHNLGRPPRRLVMLHLDGSGHVLPDAGASVHLAAGMAGTSAAGATAGGAAGGTEADNAGTGEAGTGRSLGKQVGAVTAVGRHYELGPIALAVVRRSTPEDAPLLVDCDGGAVAANQEIVVPSGGESMDRPPARGEVAKIGPARANML